MKTLTIPRERRTLSAARCWRAVMARDRRWDGTFVYGVRSTGVYCRPSCPSRKPMRRQVIFFALPETAERKGFRACRRCQPASVNHRHTVMVEQICRELERQPEARPKLEVLATKVGLGPHQLLRMFQRAMGITPRQYADALRLLRLKRGLREGEDVTTALYEAGYGSSSRLYEKSNQQLGMTPATYRRGGQGMRIGYTIVNSQLGRLLVAATERGISAVYLGDSDQPLEQALRKEYPRAEIQRQGNGLTSWVRALARHLDGQQPQLDLPTDVQATAFQRRVWERLRRIPYGTTKTYGQIARALGRPTATRAVARACATNPTSVVVPCHRVVRQDGGLGGYRWGLERKKALLEKERETRERSV